MNVKKVLMVLISLALVCSFAGAVSADTDMSYTYNETNQAYETTNSGQSTVLLNLTTVKPGFTLSIPDNIELTKQDDGKYGGEAHIQLKDIVMGENNLFGLNVSVSSDTSNDKSPWTLVKVGGDGLNIAYSMTATDYKNNEKSIAGYSEDETPDTLADILAVSAEEIVNDVTGENEYITNLKFQTTPSYVISGGEFKDTLTFTVDVIPYQ